MIGDIYVKSTNNSLYHLVHIVNMFVCIIWVYALIHLEEFTVGVKWKNVPILLKGIWWMFFLLPLTEAAKEVYTIYLQYLI